MSREILFQNRLLLLGNLDSAKLPLGCYLCTPSSSKDPVDYILAYDTHASARARTPTYLVLARTSCDTLGFKEKIYPSSDKLYFTDRDTGHYYHVLEQVRPDEVHAPEKELRRITEEGRNVVLLHPLDPGKTWFAQDLSGTRGKEQKSPSFVVVNRFDHTEGWQFAVAAHSSSSQHTRVSSLLYHIDFRQNGYSLLVTKYIQGETLLADLQRNYSIYLKRPDYAKRILVQLIEVVNWLHDRGVYHSAIDPSNVILSEDRNKIYLTNFHSAAISPRLQRSSSSGGPYNSSAPTASLSADSLTCNAKAHQDLWGVRLIAILLAYPHLPYLWSIQPPSSPGAPHPLAMLRELSISRGSTSLPISEALDSILNEALHPQTSERLSERKLRSSLAKISMREYVLSPTTITGSTNHRGSNIFKGSSYSAAVVLRLISPRPSFTNQSSSSLSRTTQQSGSKSRSSTRPPLTSRTTSTTSMIFTSDTFSHFGDIIPQTRAHQARTFKAVYRTPEFGERKEELKPLYRLAKEIFEYGLHLIPPVEGLPLTAAALDAEKREVSKTDNVSASREKSGRRRMSIQEWAGKIGVVRS